MGYAMMQVMLMSIITLDADFYHQVQGVKADYAGY
jgi:hypothetical protein